MSISLFVKTHPGNVITKAFKFAKSAHEGQKRKSGEPYFNHCMSVAQTVMDWGLDEQTVAAALLHDVVEDTEQNIEEINKNFDEEISLLVDGLTKIGKVKYRDKETQAENLRKMFLALSQDVRVVIIKLADRLHNMKTLSAVAPQKQKRIALETLELYSPLAYRLGMQHIAGQLEDLAFPYVYASEYKWLIKNVKGKFEEREKFLKKASPVLLKELKKHNIPVIKFDYRAKRYYSLYKKLLRYDMDAEKIYDLVALRIIVPKVDDCYAALGIVHKIWPPLPGRFKDYIALPKPNGYRSLHTSVISLEDRPIEIQIRTQEMHDEAELGISAHWMYEQKKGDKEYKERKATFANRKELGWIQQLRAWQKEFTNPEEFVDSLKIDFFKDRIFVITPRGKVVDLPVGATPVDFAYQIHSEVGNHATGARVNGEIVPLDRQLQSGDVVEILTQKNKKPSESWLKFVKTGIARSHIKSALKQKGGFLQKPNMTKIELRITADDRIGLLKDITAIISRSHINMQNVHTGKSGRFATLRVECDTTDKEKIERVIVKIKKELKEVREISYALK